MATTDSASHLDLNIGLINLGPRKRGVRVAQASLGERCRLRPAPEDLE
jgi:hypothetical protein